MKTLVAKTLAFVVMVPLFAACSGGRPQGSDEAKLSPPVAAKLAKADDAAHDDPDCAKTSGPSVHVISNDPLACAALLFECEPGQVSYSDDCGCGCIGEPEPPVADDDKPEPPAAGICERSVGDECKTDADCVVAGCTGELCHNPALSTGFTTCDCLEPPSKACGCVNHVCAWN